MGLNAYIQGFNSLESIDRAPGYFIKEILPDLFAGEFAGKAKMLRTAFSILPMSDQA